MKSVADLQNKFGVEDLVTVETGRGGQTCVKLTGRETPARAYVYLFGAHVTTWCDNAGVSRLFTSESALFDGKKAIRGGIPICFPQFAKLGPLAQHGFARVSYWEIESTGQDELGNGFVVMLLSSSDATKALWNHEFKLRLKVTLLVSSGGSLHCELSVENTGDEFEFTVALHSYFNITSSYTTTVNGLKGTQYRDSLQGGKVFMEEEDNIRFKGEVDRVYMNTNGALRIAMGENSGFPDLIMEKKGMPEAVVWNPHVEKSAGMADLEKNGWRHFACVEPAVAVNPVKVQGGEIWRGTLLLQ